MKQTREHVTKQTLVQPMDAKSLIEDLKKNSPNHEHPRLMARQEDFNRMKDLIHSDPNMRKWYSSLQKDSDAVLKESPVAYTLKGGDLLAVSREVLARLTNLSLMYRLSGNKQYADRAIQEMNAVAGFKDWNPAHFLDTAEMTNAMAIGFDWLYDDLTNEQRSKLSDAILEKGLRPALQAYQGPADKLTFPSWWKDTDNNWNTVVNGGIGVGALAIADETDQTEDVAGEVLAHALASIPQSLRVYAPDGGMPEGVTYWKYATSYMAYFFSSLDSVFGDDFGLSRMPGLAETGYLPIYSTGPKGAFNTGDGVPANYSSSPQLLWFASKYDHPVLAYFAIKGYSPLNLVWYRPGKIQTPHDAGLPLDKHYTSPLTDYATMRSSWEDTGAVFAAIHAGDNEANHGDLDAGDFVLDAGGTRWAMDLGSDDYGLPGYFDMKKGRWLYYRKRAEGQNTLVINPGAGPDQNPAAKSKITEFASKPDHAYSILDMTPAYEKDAISVKRGMLLFDQRQSVAVEDELNLKTKSDVWWFMHTQAAVEISKDGKTATLRSNDGKTMFAHISYPQEGTFTVMDAVPLPSSPVGKGQNANSGIRKLAIHLTNTSQTNITVVFMQAKDNQLPQTWPVIEALEKWKNK